MKAGPQSRRILIIHNTNSFIIQIIIGTLAAKVLFTCKDFIAFYRFKSILKLSHLRQTVIRSMHSDSIECVNYPKLFIFGIFSLCCFLSFHVCIFDLWPGKMHASRKITQFRFAFEYTTIFHHKSSSMNVKCLGQMYTEIFPTLIIIIIIIFITLMTANERKRIRIWNH